MRRPIALTLLLALAILACSLPGIPGTAEPTPAPPPTEEPPPPATEPSADPLVVLHDRAAGLFRVVTLAGAPVETRPASGLEWARPGNVQVVGDVIYYVDSGDASLGGVVRRVTAAGSETLPFTQAEPLETLTFAVAPDQGRIAWATASWDASGTQSELWIAHIDGSDARLAVQRTPADPLDEYYLLEAVGWFADGRVLYAWQISGIGGYILFFGYSSLYAYDPATDAVTPLAPIPGPGVGVGPCWGGLSPDAAFAAGWCGPDRVLRERNLASGAETVFPAWSDEQGQLGAAVYSPSGTRLAYAIARGDSENEAGWLLLAPHGGGDQTLVASVAPGYIDGVRWADEDRLVFSSWSGDASAVELLRLSDLVRTPLAAGRLIGLMGP